jgi:methylphosphotriester-DNA--protein-cysteine methyltransferase
MSDVIEQLEELLDEQVISGRYAGRIEDAISELKQLRADMKKVREIGAEIIRTAEAAGDSYFTSGHDSDSAFYNHKSFCNGISHGISMVTSRFDIELLQELFPSAALEAAKKGEQ